MKASKKPREMWVKQDEDTESLTENRPAKCQGLEWKGGIIAQIS